MKGLENKLDVYVGDLIKLQSSLFSVIGYVAGFNSSQVKLSHETPVGFSSGHRFYNLKEFESYKILKDPPEEKSE